MLLLLGIVAEEVAILALAFCIYHPVFVFTLGGKATPSIQMIAVVAHALGIMLGILVRASSVLTLLPSGLNYLSNYFLRSHSFSGRTTLGRVSILLGKVLVLLQLVLRV